MVQIMIQPLGNIHKVNTPKSICRISMLHVTKKKKKKKKRKQNLDASDEKSKGNDH